MQADWLTPDWPAPANVRAVCTTRRGGCSRAPYDTFNLGDHVGDAPRDVALNRAQLAAAMVARPVFLRQVHGTQVATLDAQTPDGTRADGCATAQTGVACTIMVADCLPVLLTDEDGNAVAAAHAGWRGLADGVLEVTFEHFSALVPVPRTSLATKTIAWLGPCIGPTAFEVGAEVKAAFEARDAAASAMFKPLTPDKYLADLAGLARQRLRALGITQVYGNDGSASWCTVGNGSRFFSHRRDNVRLGGSGRFAACIWMV